MVYESRGEGLMVLGSIPAIIINIFLPYKVNV